MPPKKAVDPTAALWRAIDACKLEKVKEILDAGHKYDTYDESFGFTDEAPDVEKTDKQGNNALMKLAAKVCFDVNDVRSFRPKNYSDKEPILDITEEICTDMIHIYNRFHPTTYMKAKNKAGKTALDIAIEAGNFPVIYGLFSESSALLASSADKLEAAFNTMPLPHYYKEEFRFIKDQAIKDKAAKAKAAGRPSLFRNSLKKQGINTSDSNAVSSHRDWFEVADTRELTELLVDTYGDTPAAGGGGGGSVRDTIIEKAVKDILIADLKDTLPDTSDEKAYRAVSNALNIVMNMYDKYNGEEAIIKKAVEQLKADGKTDQQIYDAIQASSELLRDHFEPWTERHRPKAAAGAGGAGEESSSSEEEETTTYVPVPNEPDPKILATRILGNFLSQPMTPTQTLIYPKSVIKLFKISLADSRYDPIWADLTPLIDYIVQFKGVSTLITEDRMLHVYFFRKDTSKTPEDYIKDVYASILRTKPGMAYKTRRTPENEKKFFPLIKTYDDIKALGKLLFNYDKSGHVKKQLAFKIKDGHAIFRLQVEEAGEQLWNQVAPTLVGKVVSDGQLSVMVGADRILHVFVPADKMTGPDLHGFFRKLILNPVEATVRDRVPNNNAYFRTAFVPKSAAAAAAPSGAAAAAAPPKSESPPAAAAAPPKSESPPPAAAPPKSESPPPAAAASAAAPPKSESPPPAATAAATPSKYAALLARKRNVSSANTLFFNAMKDGNFVAALDAMPTTTSIKLKDADSNYAIHFLAINTPKLDQIAAYKQIMHKYLELDPAHFQTAANKDGDTPFALAFMSDNVVFMNTLIELLNDMPPATAGLEAIRDELRDFAGALGANATPLAANLRNAFSRLKGGSSQKMSRARFLAKRTRRRR